MSWGSFSLIHVYKCDLLSPMYASHLKVHEYVIFLASLLRTISRLNHHGDPDTSPDIDILTGERVWRVDRDITHTAFTNNYNELLATVTGSESVRSFSDGNVTCARYYEWLRREMSLGRRNAYALPSIFDPGEEAEAMDMAGEWWRVRVKQRRNDGCYMVRSSSSWLRMKEHY